MEDKNLFVFVNGAGQKIKTNGLTVNQNSTNNVLNFISVGKYSSVTCSFKYANGKVSAEYHMIPQGKYELQADDNEAVLTENADNLYLYLFTIPYEVTSSYISGNSARMNVSFAGYAYDEKQYLKQVMSANTQIVINQAVQSDTLDQSYNAADVENMWRAIGDVTVTAADVEQNAEDIEDLQASVSNHEQRIDALENTQIINYSPGYAITFTGSHNNVINADTSILALKAEVNTKEDKLPVTSTSGLVLKSTSTPGTYAWAEGGRVYSAGSGISISDQDAISVDTTTIATVSALNAIGGRVTTIEGLIPSQATSSNQLADKDFVNSSISSSTATFRGNFATKADLDAYLGEKKNGDYAVVQTDETHNNQTWRYKYNGVAWVAEYMINESPMTAAQLAALNSGITSTLVTQIGTNQNNISAITDGASINTFSGVESALSAKASDSAVVHKAGEETISGKKTFSTKVQLVNANNYIDVDSNNATVLGAGGNNILTVNGVTSNIASNFRPTTTNTYDLGSSDYLWNNAYIHGNLSDGTTSVSVSNVVSVAGLVGNIVTLDGNQTITGIKKFSSGVYIGTGTKRFYDDGPGIKPSVSLQTLEIFPQGNNSSNLGRSEFLWKNLYLGGVISDGTNSVSVANIAPKSLVGLKIFTSSSSTLTDEMIAALKEGGIILEGDFTASGVAYHNPILFKAQYTGSGDMWGIGFGYTTSQEHTVVFQYRISQSNKQFAISSYPWLDLSNIGSINGKTFPAYPTTNTSPLALTVAANGGALSWSENNIFTDATVSNILTIGTTGELSFANSGFTFNDDLLPSVTNADDLGSASYNWRDLYLSGAINKNSSGYGLRLPSTTGLSADKTLATTGDIGNGALTIQAEGVSKGTFNANQSGNTTINITAADLGLSGALKFIGISSTAISDGSTTQVITIDGNQVTAQNGNVAIYGNVEYLWNGTLGTPCWEQLGDEASYALKSVTITGTGVLAGGGSLEANRTITHNEVLGSAVTTSDVYKLKIDKYGHISEAVSAGLSTVAFSGDYDDLTDTPYIPVKVSDLQNDTGFTTNTGTVTGITAGAGLNTTSNDTGTDGGTISTSGTLYLTKTAVTPGTYQGITVDKYGRVTGASDQGYSTTTGTVTSVRVQAGTGLTSSQSTTQSTSLDTTISIASGYKLPTTSEWSSKQDASTAYNTSNIVYSVTEPASPTAGMIWLEPVE